MDPMCWACDERSPRYWSCLVNGGSIVGLLLCETKDELLSRLPLSRPSYSDPRLSAYTYLNEVGANERYDPYYFGPSLAREIASCPGQGIGTHTFSHYYCLENGQTLDQFKADLDCAIIQLRDWGRTCRSIVFPRNQYTGDHLAVCHDLGLTHFRGSEPAWFMSPIPYGQETKARRALRLLDSYLNIGGQHVPPAQRHPSGLSNVASSRFLRPYHPRLAALDGLRLRRVTQGMRNAAQTDGTFHLWWHPHNFGSNVEANIAFLTMVLAYYERLSGEFGMNSKTMSGLSAVNDQPPDVVKSSGGAS